MNTLPVDGKLLLRRSPEERKPLIERLNRIEGQIRGLAAMVQADRYCGEELHQIKAAIAALRRVAIMLTEQHVAATAEVLTDRELKAMASQEIARILSAALEM